MLQICSISIRSVRPANTGLTPVCKTRNFWRNFRLFRHREKKGNETSNELAKFWAIFASLGLTLGLTPFYKTTNATIKLSPNFF